MTPRPSTDQPKCLYLLLGCCPTVLMREDEVKSRSIKYDQISYGPVALTRWIASRYELLGGRKTKQLDDSTTMRRGQVATQKQIDPARWHGVSKCFHPDVHFRWSIPTTDKGDSGPDADAVLGLLNSRVMERLPGRRMWKRRFELATHGPSSVGAGIATDTDACDVHPARRTPAAKASEAVRIRASVLMRKA